LSVIADVQAGSIPRGEDMPRVPFGAASISRLILGANPINAGSHLSVFVNHQMRRYFTPENLTALFRRCEELGVNTWQSGASNLPRWQHHGEAGGGLQYISLAAPDPADPGVLARLAAAGVLGVAHHGELTDALFKAGRLAEVREYCRAIRDTGVQVGVSTHMPAVIEAIEEQGWDVDFYMACVYERHRSREELQRLLGAVPIPVPEVYLESDPARMCEVIRQTPRTCLAFKILAAGRLCETAEQVEAAFEFTFSHIKPTDAVIVGIYPEYSDQVAEDAALTIRYGSPNGAPLSG
jgi:hypothetical protein